MKGTTRFAMCVLGLILIALLVATPAMAIKVYVNPSIQTSNYSPDGTYQEGANMQDVASRLMSKLQARGFEARNSAWMDMGSACADSNNWGSNCFVALHTNAAGSGGWNSARGTQTFYHQNSSGWHNESNVWFAQLINNKLVSKFGAFGRGYNAGVIADYPYMGWNMYVIAPWNTYAVPATLVEGLFHTNWDDTYGVLKSDAGRDAYAQGVFEGICDYFGWAYGGARGTGTPAIGVNADGRMQAFVVGENGVLYSSWQTAPNGGWYPWTSMGGGFVGSPSVVRNSAGCLTVFIRTTGSSIATKWQNSPNASWVGDFSSGSLPCTLSGDPVAALNQNGTMQVFCRGGDNRLYTNYEGASWSGWFLIANTCYGNPAVTLNSSGRLVAFFRGTSNRLDTVWENNPNNGGSWSGGNIGGVWTRDPAVAQNTDGRMQVFCVGNDNNFYTNYESSGGWSGWVNLGGGPYTGTPAITRTSTGSLAAFIPSGTSMYTKWQSSPNSNTWYSGSIGGVWTAHSPSASKNLDGRMQVICVGDDGNVYSCCETSGGWSAWSMVSGYLP